ncbi:MAG: arginine--tRNA ligase [Gemmataceae bacterium]
MNLLRQLQAKFEQALAGLTPDPAPYVQMVKATADPKHGDYQANCAMSLAKTLGRKPPEVAADLKGKLQAADMLEEPEIAGPGFLNLRLKGDWLAGQIQKMAADERLTVSTIKPRTFVIDYSSPNVAKPMHVGHLRSTIIGDALARLLRFLGHKVIADNHLGDWGTQFGMLIHGYKRCDEWLTAEEKARFFDDVNLMAKVYVNVQKIIASETSPGADAEEAESPTADACRQETARLHEGDPENVALWKRLMPLCLEEIDRIYRRLDVHFDHTLGESHYNPMLPGVVAELEDKGIAQESKGAIAIFFGAEDPPALIRKRDGAFTYTTTDLATIRHRVIDWQADAVLYVVDFRQALHFKNLFDAARRWGFDKVELEHISFGSVLGQNKKPIKTREGGAVELGQLLDEAVAHGRESYEKTRADRIDRGEDVPDLSDEEIGRIAEVVGLGAVKYADLSQNRTSDYVFSWDKMLATDGNTATYMQYAFVRVRGIFRKGDEDPARFRTSPVKPHLETPQERQLALQLLRFEETLAAAAAEYKPNLITDYLWNLAKAYSRFFNDCPVLKAETPMLRESRLLLCDLTARVLEQALCLLGIQTVERM